MNNTENIDLFTALMQNNDIPMANIVLKNKFNKNISNPIIFEEFLDFCIKISNWNIDLPTRKSFLEQAESAVIYFSENASLDITLINLIKHYNTEIAKSYAQLEEDYHHQDTKRITQLETTNDENLLMLQDYKHKIRSTNNQKEFNHYLQKVHSLEKNINKNSFTIKQEKDYEQLNTEYEKIINEKIQYFEKKTHKQYNKKAVKDYNYIFNEFKGDESRYKNNFLELKPLLKKHLLSYNTDHLYGETMIYYNNVYSYIFSKISEDSKFKLTELAIESEKVQI